MTEHHHVKSARQLAEKTRENFHETKGYFEASHMGDQQHPRVAAAQELAAMAAEHHQEVSGFMAGQSQASDADWRSQTPTGQIPARRR